MFAIKSIENPVFKNCHQVSSECGYAFVVARKEICKQQNDAVAASPNVKQVTAHPKAAKKNDVLSRLADDEFEREFACANRIMWE